MSTIDDARHRLGSKMSGGAAEATIPPSVEEGAFADAPPQARSVLSSAWPYALILLVGLFILLPKLGEFGFWDPWEPKYAESSREMLERGSYIVPYYRGDVRLTKPILVYWGILAGAAVFGLNELGARVVGVCMALGAMLGVFYAVSTLRGRQAGLLAALILGSVPHFFFISRQAMPDVYLFTSLGCCLVFFALGLFGPDRRRDLHFAVSYACFALAVLAKGPVVVGAVFFTTLAVYTVALIDTRRLWQPDLRPAWTRFLATAGPSALLLPAFSLSAFLFGTSPLWWGYSTVRRREVAEIRRNILAQIMRFRLAEILLVLFGLVALLLAVSLWRRDRFKGRTSAVGFAGLAAAVAAAALVFGSMPIKVLVASILGLIACSAVIAWSFWKLVRVGPLWSVVQPYLRPVARQVLLFVAVFFVVAGPWHIGILVEQGHGYFTDFILKHNIQRAGEKINQSGVTDYYMRVLIFGFFPWSCFIPIALSSLVDWRDRRPLRRYGFEVYLLLACAVIFAAFSSSVTKFPHYLAPIIVPMAVLIGLAVHWASEARNPRSVRLAWVVAAMLFVLPMLDLLRDDGIKYLVGTYTVKRYVPDELIPGTYFAGLLVAFAAFLLVSALVRSRVLVGGLVVAAVLFAHYNTNTFIPTLSAHKTMKRLTESWKRYRAPEEPIGFYGDLKHGIYFYTNYEIDRLRGKASFFDFMDPEQPAFCIMEREHLKAMRAEFSRRFPGHELHSIDKSHFDYILMANHSVDGVE